MIAAVAFASDSALFPSASGIEEFFTRVFQTTRLKTEESRTGAEPLWFGSGWSRLGGVNSFDYFRDPEAGITVVFDGDLYRRSDLSARFGVDTGMADAQIVAKAYLRFGDKFAHYLDGDFAILVADEGRRRLLATRDPFGVRPLFFHENKRGIWFASWPEQLVRGLRLALEVNPETIHGWLNRRFESRGTFWARISQVFPGHTAVFENGRLEQTRFFRPQFDEIVTRTSFEEASRILKDAVVEATTDRIQASSRTLLHLSGGIDSGFVAHAAAEALRNRRISADSVILGSCRFSGQTHDEGSAIAMAVSELPFSHREWDGRILDAANIDDPIVDWPEGRHVNNWGTGEMDLARDSSANGVIGGYGGDEWALDTEIWLEALVRGQWGDWIRSISFWNVPLIRERLGLLKSAGPAFLSDASYKKYRVFRRTFSDRVQEPFRPAPLADSDFSAWLDGSSDDCPAGSARAVWRRIVYPRLWQRSNNMSRMWDGVGVRFRLPLLSQRLLSIVLSFPAVKRIPIRRVRRLERSAFSLIASDAVLQTRSKAFFNAEIPRYFHANAASIKEVVENKSGWLSEVFVDRVVLNRELRRLMTAPEGFVPVDVLPWWRVKAAVHLEAWLVRAKALTCSS